jgi:hypothetical protein
MGVDYRVWLVPKERSFKPSADRIPALANALYDGNWVPLPEAQGHRSRIVELMPGHDSKNVKPHRSEPISPTRFESSWVEFHNQHELAFEWWVDDAEASGVQFPFNFVPYPESGHTYFGIRLMSGSEYFYWTGETVMEFGVSETQCQCGKQLAYWGFAPGLPSQRIIRQCPACDSTFDVSKLAAGIQDCWTGEERLVNGGLAFRFALQVDCHKNFPHEENEFRRFRLKDSIQELWQSHISVPYEMIDTAD